jgi:hypothetical protein
MRHSEDCKQAAAARQLHWQWSAWSAHWMLLVLPIEYDIALVKTTCDGMFAFKKETWFVYDQHTWKKKHKGMPTCCTRSLLCQSRMQ